MAETERNEKVSAGYRALGGEEPPRALDEAILAASRRSPSRWRVPLSVAAVLVLAVGVTLRMLPQRPDAESVALAPQVMETLRPAAPPPAAAREQAKPAAGVKASSEIGAADAAAESRARSDIAAKPGSRALEAPAPAAAGGIAQAPLRSEVAAKLAKENELTPQAWLERIAELRKQNRQREADESLAEFRKRYPDYKIPAPLR
jgi:hypothetical protein